MIDKQLGEWIFRTNYILNLIKNKYIVIRIDLRVSFHINCDTDRMHLEIWTIKNYVEKKIRNTTKTK